VSDPGSATGRGGGGGEGGGGPPPPRGFRATVEVVPRVRLSRFASGERGRERESERAERRWASVSVRPAEVFVAGPGSVASGGESKGRRSEDRTGRGNRGDVDELRGGRSSLL